MSETDIGVVHSRQFGMVMARDLALRPVHETSHVDGPAWRGSLQGNARSVMYCSARNGKDGYARAMHDSADADEP